VSPLSPSRTPPSLPLSPSLSHLTDSFSRIRFLTPTLTPQWLAGRMVEIVESGLSDHLIAPGFASLTLPAIRSMPEWFRWTVHTVCSPPLTRG
jgi:hypothetical protein